MLSARSDHRLHVDVKGPHHHATARSVLVALSAGFLSFVAGCGHTNVSPCELAGDWVKDDNTERIRLYRSHAQWFGRLTWTSKQGVQPGPMLRSFVHDGATDLFIGTLIVPSSGVRVEAELSCVGDGQIQVSVRQASHGLRFTFKKTTP
jgi:hypothetical protein